VHAREWPGHRDLQAIEIKAGTYEQYDCVVIVTDHKTFDYDAMVAGADLIVDTRNAIKQQHPHVFRLGASRPDTAERAGVA
jgi:UDP-N-acetyl-D-glucosamine dehydrogenase